MKYFIRTYLAFSFFMSLSVGAYAAGEVPANISRGHVQLGGSVSLSHSFSTEYGSYTTFSYSMPLQIFVADHLSVGAIYSYEQVGSESPYIYTYKKLGVGPAATYYFWTQDSLAAYFSESIQWQKTIKYNTDWPWSNRLGINYFIIPSVAVGPALDYTHIFTKSIIDNRNNISLFATFSIYL